jgi:hypothetical protein
LKETIVFRDIIDSSNWSNRASSFTVGDNGSWFSTLELFLGGIDVIEMGFEENNISKKGIVSYCNMISYLLV